MNIRITMDVDHEFTDPDDPSGLTDWAFRGIFHALQPYGYDIEITDRRREAKA